MVPSGRETNSWKPGQFLVPLLQRRALWRGERKAEMCKIASEEIWQANFPWDQVVSAGANLERPQSSLGLGRKGWGWGCKANAQPCQRTEAQEGRWATHVARTRSWGLGGGVREALAQGPCLLDLPGQPALRPRSLTPAAAHLAQHFAPAVAFPRRGVDDNPRDLGSRVRVVVMVVRGRRGHLGLGLPVFRGLLWSLLLRVPATSFAQRLLAHLGASSGLIGDSPQEFHRGPATRHCLLPPPRHGPTSGIALALEPQFPLPTDYSDVLLRLCERERAAKLYKTPAGWGGAAWRHGERSSRRLWSERRG